MKTTANTTILAPEHETFRYSRHFRQYIQDVCFCSIVRPSQNAGAARGCARECILIEEKDYFVQCRAVPVQVVYRMSVIATFPTVRTPLPLFRGCRSRGVTPPTCKKSKKNKKKRKERNYCPLIPPGVIVRRLSL